MNVEMLSCSGLSGRKDLEDKKGKSPDRFF
jgi:hypothetical protein